MSNRHQRRAEVRAFRRDVHHDHIVTYLVAADAQLDHHPLLSRALSYWRGNVVHLRPYLPGMSHQLRRQCASRRILFSTRGRADISIGIGILRSVLA